ncbi:MAG TPA: hypothetical protein VNQ33_06510 [Acidimicrobiales bacterium]|nr:hypothetical protein [Acidimicrobiales bacterium]
MRRRPALDHAPLGPASRSTGPTPQLEYFPGEVAQLLDLGDITYEQLRTLLLIARAARGEALEPGAWARFSVEDLASTEVLVGLVGGRERFREKRRLTISDIEPACRELRKIGFANPLLEVPLARHGRLIVALVGRHVYSPTTGQFAFAFMGEQVEQFVARRAAHDREARTLLRQVQRERRERRAAARTPMAELEARVAALSSAI